ncbi:sensor domain-containing diguanylate cyclase [Solimonas soli]|uniref:sensor domain-containing diguanylate cyclase n=1 Tax=Solimonas soli TaxID=413479 RepID=UPI00047F6825|nr:sensor domain-containing diguanylate cyclase [Solimonas soli]
MQAPAIPEDEIERLAQLRALRILDSPIEARFERITRLARRTFDVPISAISLLDSDRQWFKSVAGLTICETSREVSFCGHALHSDEVMVVDDAGHDPRFADNPLVTGDPRIRFYAGCPVRGPAGARLGTLCLIDRKPRQMSGGDREALADFAKMVEAEFRLNLVCGAQDELLAELDRMRLRASIDPLTRLWNRGAMNEILRRELAAARGDGKGTGLVLVDLDHFKQINDSHGHAVGDEVLREAAARMLAAIRARDSLGRYGGEEFLAIVPEATPEDARTVAERLRAALAGEPLPTLSGPIGVTASLGVRWVEARDRRAADELLRPADAALYRAKRGGRNRVEIGDAQDAGSTSS